MLQSFLASYLRQAYKVTSLIMFIELGAVFATLYFLRNLKMGVFKLEGLFLACLYSLV
jgi:hypothetical protein